MLADNILTPNGIRFECSGCGNCCLQWPVPATKNDYKRVCGLTINDPDPGNNPVHLFRELNSATDSLQSFTHTLEKRSDGKCAFLTTDNRCRLHQEFGADSKPSMCQLFPYYFTVTPDAVLCSVSFASSAVLFNSGKLLSEQTASLQEKFAQFKELFADNSLSWNNLQIIDGISLSWNEFRDIDARFSALIGAETPLDVPRGLPGKMLKLSACAANFLKQPELAEKSPRLEASPKIVDQLILKHLDRLYFPEDFNGPLDLDARALLSEIVAAPHTVLFGQKRFAELIKYKLDKLPPDQEDLLDRFFYCRIFSKSFFGPGFHHLSLLSGIHHLIMLQILIRLKVKEQHLRTGLTELEFTDFAEIIRSLEQRLTQLKLSAEAKATLEVLLTSPQRANRAGFLGE